MVKQNVLKTLYENLENCVSGEDIASKLNISKEELLDQIESLKDDGYVIESSDGENYCLRKTPNLLLPYELKRNLETEYIGHEVHYFKKVDSTNEVAKKLAEEGSPEGTLVVAESQSRGRGRRGKKWVSPEGGVWMSMILRPEIPPMNAPQLTLVTGVAVAETLKSECGLDVGIKWPNDILIGDKKVCGILTEVSATVDMVDYVVVGIGIDLNVDVNLFPPELRSGATSLKMELEREIQSVKLVQKFLINFEKTYGDFKEGKFPEILKEWRILSTTIGNYVEVHKRGRTLKGEAVGINKDGVLIVELDDGTLKKVLSGECIHVKK
jgi:BirA family biotin operon repressor/biotin-[acetyl-CoA-carboxylase] ligase